MHTLAHFYKRVNQYTKPLSLDIVFRVACKHARASSSMTTSTVCSPLLPTHLRMMKSTGRKRNRAAAQWGYTGGEFLQKVADLKLNPPLGVPRVKMACYMAALNCPVQYTSNGQCKFITPADIAKLQSKKELAMPIAEAEKLYDFVQKK